MKLLSILLLTILSLSSMYAVPIDYDQDQAYTHPAIVVLNSITYISVKDVPAGTTITSTDYWRPLLDTAPEEEPGEPPTTDPGDFNFSNEIIPPIYNTAEIFGISIRGGVYGDKMSGSLTLGGASENKNILFRVKGPTMNFGGPKLANPTIKALSKETGSWQTLFEANDFGDHESAATYADRGTGNDLEPIAVISKSSGTYSCQMDAEDGGTGNANMEIKGFEDENSTTYFQGISVRAYIGDYPMSGSLTIIGSGSIEVMFRVKGPTMNFGGEKLADPKIKILEKIDGVWTTLIESSSFGDHSSSTTYADRATGNNLEPMVVVSLSEGTYSCQALSDVEGGTGNANMEIKLVE